MLQTERFGFKLGRTYKARKNSFLIFRVATCVLHCSWLEFCAHYHLLNRPSEITWSVTIPSENALG